MFRYLDHRFGNKGITCDSANITSGMIYIDLNSKKRNDICNAYKNGASLIITSRNVSDPLLPVIKVKDIEETYFSLLNHLYERPIDKVKLIGVYGGNRGKFTVRLLDTIFANNYLKSIEKKKLADFTYAFVSEKYNSIAERFFYYILLCLSNNISIIPLNYSDNFISFESILKPRYDCNILIDESSAPDIAICSAGVSKPLIINIDEPHLIKAIGEENKNIVITYGLNKKAAVTATSIEYGEVTEFIYCLQRTFYSKSGAIIEPFEAPISIKGLGINKIYSALAAISCALYYDIDLKCIKEALLQIDDIGRDFSIKKYESFILIDNYCKIEQDYEEAFEMLQMLDYRNLHVIISDSSSCNKEFYMFVYDLINEWRISLNIKELIIIAEKNRNTPTQSLELLENTRVSYFNQLSKALSYSLQYLSNRDVLLILGGDEMNSSQGIIELLLTK